MTERKLPRPGAQLAQFQPYRTQMLKADVRINANEWPEPNPVSRYLRADELDGIILNRYPGRGDELREVLSARWGTAPDELMLGNGSNELLLQVFLVFGGHDRKTLLFHPTYSMHGRLTEIAGGTVATEMVGLPYNVSTLTLTVAARVARDEKAVAHRLELAAGERARVLAALRKVPTIEVFPSVTNFILFRLREGTPAEIHARFLAQSVLIRDV